MEGVEMFLAILQVFHWLPGVEIGALSDPLNKVEAVLEVKDLLNLIFQALVNIAAASSYSLF